jgi:hypothetical protein
VNNGDYISAPGSVENGDTLQVRHTSATRSSTNVTTTLTVGGVAGKFISKTGDTTPDRFAFLPRTNVPLSTLVESDTVTVTGIGISTPISISGGEYRINDGDYTSATGTVENGDTVRLRHTSSASFATSAATTLNIGGVSGKFSSKTLAKDTKPDAFGFTSQTNVPLNTVLESDVITISGINAPAAVTVRGGSYRVNNGDYISAPGSVENGDTLQVRHTSGNRARASVLTILTVGGVRGEFSSVTTLFP